LSGAAQSVLLYDADCSFCRWSLDKILAWDRAQRLRPVPIQGEEGSRLLAPIARDARLDSWHLIGSDGRLFSAGAAAQPLARLLPGGRPLAALFAAFPGVTERAYQLVARHRDDLARLLRIDPNCQVRPHG
jgi:predicted DCC family thiol-disulfide oxidoreductase YuxK